MNLTNLTPSYQFSEGIWGKKRKQLYLFSTSGSDYGTTGGDWNHTHTLSSNGYAKRALHGTGRGNYAEITVPNWNANYGLKANGGVYETVSEPYACALGGTTDTQGVVPPYYKVVAWVRTA